MVVGDVFDQTLEQYRVVAGLDGVGNVVQVHFELRRGTFFNDGVSRDALLFGTFQNVLEAVDVFIEVVDQVPESNAGVCRRSANVVAAGDR